MGMGMVVVLPASSFYQGLEAELSFEKHVIKKTVSRSWGST
jgi:hypothetical protein